MTAAADRNDDEVVVRHLRVHGRVQGVFFRDSTRRRAQRQDVTGWVRNCPDGTLEAWLEGSRDGVDSIERWIRRGGPPAANVDEVEASSPDPEGHETFQIRP